MEKTIVLGLLLLLMLGGAVYPGPAPAPAPAVVSQPTVTLIPTLMPTSAWPTTTPTPEPNPWDSHFTIVLMGIDSRPAGASMMTDVIMLFDVNMEAGTMALLSLPRDVYFWTGLPTEPLRQVNRFYALAELDRRGTGGEAVMAMLAYNLDLEVDAYAVIDFTVFVRLIDAIGGVEIALSKPISDPTFPDMNFGYDPLELPAGTIHMDGDLALRYIRTRHSDSDYGRILRQQGLLRGVLAKLALPSTWQRVMRAVPGLWRDLRGHIDTNLGLDQLMQLIDYVEQIPLDSMAMAVCSVADDCIEKQLIEGRQVWVLRPEDAQRAVRTIFGMAVP